MALPADDLVVVRKWIGEEADGAPSDAEFEALYNVYENYDKAVWHVLTQRLSTLTLEAGSVTVPGVSISHSTDLTALQDLMKRFVNEGTGLEDEVSLNLGFSVTSMKRNYPR